MPPRDALTVFKPFLGLVLAGSPASHPSSVRGGGPERAEPTSLRAVPSDVVLRGPNSVQQLIVDALNGNQDENDATGSARFVTSDPTVATVESMG
jgi:hypothetical protein